MAEQDDLYCSLAATAVEEAKTKVILFLRRLDVFVDEVLGELLLRGRGNYPSLAPVVKQNVQKTQ